MGPELKSVVRDIVIEILVLIPGSAIVVAVILFFSNILGGGNLSFQASWKWTYIVLLSLCVLFELGMLLLVAVGDWARTKHLNISLEEARKARRLGILKEVDISTIEADELRRKIQIREASVGFAEAVMKHIRL